MKPQKETLRHREAFEFYLTMGSDRSLAQVAKKFGVSNVAAENWSRTFGWANRVRDREREAALALAEKTKTDYLKAQERHLQIAKAIQGAFANRLMPFVTGPDGEKLPNPSMVKPDARDFVMAAQMERELLAVHGGAGGFNQDTSELIRLVLYVLHSKLPDFCPHCRAALEVKNEIADEFGRLSEQFMTAAKAANESARSRQ